MTSEGKKIIPKVHVELQGDVLTREMVTSVGWELSDSVYNSDLVILCGGEDVSPSFYGEPLHPATRSSPARDARTSILLEKAVKEGVPVVGICRGAQFLNVACGGRMYQHVHNHTKRHQVRDLPTGKVHWVTSTHHQQMIANDELCVVRAVAYRMDYPIRQTMEGGVQREYLGVDGYKGVMDEMEVLYYPHIDGLCFQPHPEYGDRDTTSYFFELLQEYYPQFDYGLVPSYLEKLQ